MDRTRSTFDVQEQARELWASFTENEQHGIRFGLFPAAKMTAAERAGCNGTALAVALMAIARENGGMRA